MESVWEREIRRGIFWVITKEMASLVKKQNKRESNNISKLFPKNLRGGGKTSDVITRVHVWVCVLRNRCS